MSYMVTITIACDDRGCKARLPFQRVNRGGLSKTLAGYLAAMGSGWYVRGLNSGRPDPTIAYCPEHRDAHVRPEGDAPNEAH